MKRIEKIIQDERNLGLDFVVHIQNQGELQDLAEVLVKAGFEIQFSLEYDDLREWMEAVGREDGYDTCFRIRNREGDKCAAYNPSIEHWRKYCGDILELRDGELTYHEGVYDLRAARTEAGKIWRQLQEDEEIVMSLFEFKKDITEDEIVQWLLNAGD